LFFDTWRVALSRDGKNAYVVAGFGDRSVIGVFALNRKTGSLTMLAGTDGCVTETGTDGVCGDGVGLLDVGDVAVSQDGRNVYVVSTGSNAVAAFARKP
jgi:DNA-binding beta-propeller fold protein YncE